MRDPRSGFAGFAKGIGARDPSSRAVRCRALVWGALLACACGGAAASSTNGAAVPPGPASAPPAPIAPAAPSAPRALPLRYAAADGCPTVEAYLGNVESRASALELQPTDEPGELGAVASGDASVEVRVEPAPDASGWLGHVTIAGPRALEREVRGERCDDVVAALALITVLRLEGSGASERELGASGPSAGAPGAPDAAAAATGTPAPSAAPGASGSSATPSAQDSSPASSEPSATGSPPAAPTPPGPPPAASPPSPAPAAPGATTAVPAPPAQAPTAAPDEREEERDEPAAAAATPRETAPSSDAEGPLARSSRSGQPGSPEAIGGESSEPEPPSDTPSSAEGEPAEASSGSWPATSFGVVALAGYATVPSDAFRAALEGELRLGEGTSAWLSSLAFAYTRGNHSLAPSELGLTLLTLELALCPPSFVAERSLWISACASVRGGAVQLSISSADAIVSQNDQWRPWLALGPSLRVGVPLSERWALRGVAELAVQLVRDTYNVALSPPRDPATESVPLYRPEAVSLEVGAGIGYSF